jgi:hypothetical protein
LGLGCTLQKLHDGRYFVSPQPGFQRGNASTQENGYVGEGPFSVYRRTDRDVVECKLIETTLRKDAPEDFPRPTLLQFGFAMRFYWQYDEGSGWTDFGGPNSFYTPFPLPGSNRWSFGDGLDVNGVNLAVAGVPKLVDTPIRPVQDYPTDPAWEAGFLANAVDTDYRITEVRFFFGNVVPGPTDVPNATGTWNIVWDERPDDVGFPDTTTITATHTVGTFQMLGTEDPTDSTTWPVINPSLSWSILSTEQIWFNGLRIERVS